MARQLVIVLSEPTEGMEAEFDEWYEHTHIDEVLASTGWTSGQRFVLGAEQGQSCRLHHLAVYETDAPDAQSVLDELNATRGERRQSPSFDQRKAALWVFTPTGDRHDAR